MKKGESDPFLHSAFFILNSNMLDYLAVGHVTEDVWRDGRITPGGTVMYSARAAQRMVARVGVLTAAAATFDMAAVYPDIEVHRIDAPTTTQFENIYTPHGRVQITRPCLVDLEPQGDLQAKILHLAPVCNEVSAKFAAQAPRSVFVGVTPQGWLRRWNGHGRVSQHPSNWKDADIILSRADAIVSSVEDVNGDWQVLCNWAARCKLLVATQGPEGCTVFISGKPTHVPAPPVTEVEATGAGDIFAAALFIALQRGDDPVRACTFANCIAAHSVTLPQLEGLPTAEVIEQCSKI